MQVERWRPTAAAAGIETYIFMPKDVPLANRLEVEASGAHLTLVDGLISDCGRMVAERKDKEGWFDVSTMKEPFRVEGKKTMGYEVAEQLGWRLPAAIIYPTGGGVGLIGMWKAFEEMEAIGWIRAGLPSADDLCPDSRLCADRESLRRAQRYCRDVAQRAHHRRRLARSESVCRLHPCWTSFVRVGELRLPPRMTN